MLQPCAEVKGNDFDFYRMIFSFCTYFGLAFVLCGWVMLIYIALKLHRVDRTGELLRADCNRGYLEHETGQAMVSKAYTDLGYKKLNDTALTMVKTGLAFLAASLFVGLVVPILKIEKAMFTSDIFKTPKEWWRIAWCVLSAYVLSTSIATVVNGDNLSLTMGFMITAIILMFVLYMSALLYFSKQLLNDDGMFLSKYLWIFTLIIGGGIWLASTLYYKSIDDKVNMYSLKLQELETRLKLVDKSLLKLHVAKNYVGFQPKNKSAPDDPPSLKTFDDLMVSMTDGVSPEMVYYIMHYDGEELRDVEAHLREQQRNNKTTEMSEISVEQSTAIKDVRETMAQLRLLNIEFNDMISMNTGCVVGASALVVIIPAFVIYNRVAPAIFGSY